MNLEKCIKEFEDIQKDLRDKLQIELGNSISKENIKEYIEENPFADEDKDDDFKINCLVSINIDNFYIYIAPNEFDIRGEEFNLKYDVGFGISFEEDADDALKNFNHFKTQFGTDYEKADKYTREKGHFVTSKTFDKKENAIQEYIRLYKECKRCFSWEENAKKFFDDVDIKLPKEFKDLSFYAGNNASFSWLQIFGEWGGVETLHYEISKNKNGKFKVKVDFEGNDYEKLSKEFKENLPITFSESRKEKWIHLIYQKNIEDGFKALMKMVEFYKGSVEVLKEITEKSSLKKKIKKRLKQNRQVILTGAPGTGKTFTAKEIAEEIVGADNEECIGFCQFHPSYDYTDFVEGLRPVKSAGSSLPSFERMDGVFKAFCKKALQNKKDNLEEAYEKLIEDINNDPNEKMTIQTKAQQKDFYLTVNENGNIQYLTSGDTKNSVSKEKIRKTSLEDKGSYVPVIQSLLKEKYEYKVTEKKSDQKYVFIIDEINRGDISKIFGELFYAIDPGYRGKDGKIKTQYANLIEKGDEFEEGFYVPENVYIIGTMNDIDRSVESMDFAIRRRFDWIEVTAEDSQEMLEGDTRKESINRMNSLNHTIEDIDGLNKAYHIGASYFRKVNKDYSFDELWDNNLEPLLREYLRGFSDVDKKIGELKEAYNPKSKEEKTDSSEGNE